MPGSFGVSLPSGRFGEFGTVSMRIDGNEIDTWKSYTISSHFLTPTDSFRFEVGDEILQSELIDLLVPGAKVELFIDDDKQMTGYIDVVDTNTDRSGGTTIIIEGRDSMSPVLDSQIDPDHHYPDKTPLDKLIRDVLEPFGFTKFEIANEANISVSAGKAAKAKTGRRHKTHRKALSKYPIPKSKPQHNDSFFVFLSRITQRYGLWVWPTVDGDGVIVDKPDYDQDPLYQIRRRIDGRGNNVQSGGVRRDAAEQPSFIVARGNIPARTVEHSRMVMVIGNPYDDAVGRVLGVRPAAEGKFDIANQLGLGGETGSFNSLNQRERTKKYDDEVARILGVETDVPANSALTLASEPGALNSFAQNRRFIKEKTKTYIPQKQITEVKNAFASRIAKPRFLRDKDSRTIEELEHFARRQMSLCARKAFVAKYVVEGLRLDGLVPQVNTIVDVQDELSRFSGRLWVQARTITQSRHGGTSIEIELLPPQSIQL